MKKKVLLTQLSGTNLSHPLKKFQVFQVELTESDFLPSQAPNSSRVISNLKGFLVLSICYFFWTSRYVQNSSFLILGIFRFWSSILRFEIQVFFDVSVLGTNWKNSNRFAPTLTLLVCWCCCFPKSMQTNRVLYFRGCSVVGIVVAQLFFYFSERKKVAVSLHLPKKCVRK